MDRDTLEEASLRAAYLAGIEQQLLTELKLSLIRDIVKLTNKQLEYILNNLKGEIDNAFTT